MHTPFRTLQYFRSKYKSTIAVDICRSAVCRSISITLVDQSFVDQNFPISFLRSVSPLPQAKTQGILKRIVPSNFPRCTGIDIPPLSVNCQQDKADKLTRKKVSKETTSGDVVYFITRWDAYKRAKRIADHYSTL